MLTDEQKEAIDDGMITFEELKAELGGNTYGDRVTEIRLIGLMKGYSSGVQDTMFTIDDLKKKPIKEVAKAKANVDEDSVPFNVDEDDDI